MPGAIATSRGLTTASPGARHAYAEGWRSGVRLRTDSGPAPSFDFCPEHADDVQAIREVRPP